MEGSQSKNHEDHIAGKGMKSLQSCAQIYSSASSNENTRCTGSSGEILRKNEKIPAWQQTKVRNKTLSSQEFGVGATVSKTQRQSRTPRSHCER